MEKPISQETCRNARLFCICHRKSPSYSKPLNYIQIPMSASVTRFFVTLITLPDPFDPSQDIFKILRLDVTVKNVSCSARELLSTAIES